MGCSDVFASKVDMPAFLFAEFDFSLEGIGRENVPVQESFYALRDAFEKVLLSHGCRWLKPQGRRLLGVVEEAQALPALAALLRDLGSQRPGRFPVPFKVAAHVGPAFQSQEGYVGPEKDRALCLLDAAEAGYPLLSAQTAALPLPIGTRRLSVGPHLLRDLVPAEELFLLCPEGDPAVGVPIPKTMGTYRHNLPPQPTPFLGRAELLRDLESGFLEGDERLLTLLGPGGFGKTRLALQLGANLVDRFDGVYWVPLASLLDKDRMMVALAGALGLVSLKGEEPTRQVLEALRGRRCLLILDNFEHMMGAREALRRLLDETPSRVVITSREVLGMQGERVVEVSGLSAPMSADDPLFEEHGATQLFLTTLARLGRDVPLDVEERAHFATLCRKLHGMPLGIEMSASLAATQPLSEIARRVGECVDGLATSLPHLPERQKSARAVFDYSWDLLDEGCRKVLSRLSIIRGSFDDAAAQEVAHCDPASLRRLKDRSLLVFLADGQKMLHETVRFYAKERLYESPQEKEKVLAVHARHYLSYLVRSTPRLLGKDQRAHLERAAERHENVLKAFLWAFESGQWGWVIEAAEPLAFFFERRTRYHEGYAFFGHLLERMGEDERDMAAGHLWASLALRRVELGARMGLTAGSRENLQKCLRLFQGREFRRQRAQARLALGGIWEALGEREKSLAELTRALRAFESCRDVNGAAHARNVLGQVLRRAGKAAAAERTVRRALVFFERAENPSGAAWSHMLLGQAALQLTRLNEAKEHFRLGLDGYLASGNRDGVGWAMNMMGQVANLHGDHEGAEQMFWEDLLIERDISNYPAFAWAHLQLAETYCWRGRLDMAEGHARQAWDIYERLGDPCRVGTALRVLAEVALERGDLNEAERWLRDAESAAVRFSDAPGLAWGGYLTARLAQKRGRLRDAELSLREALRRSRGSQDSRVMDWGRLLEAQIALQKGETASAKKALREALRSGRAANLAPVLLECGLVWAQIAAQQGDFLEAVEWAEAVGRWSLPDTARARKAVLLREEWEARLDEEERAVAREVSTTADLALWMERLGVRIGGRRRGIRARKTLPRRPLPIGRR